MPRAVLFGVHFSGGKVLRWIVTFVFSMCACMAQVLHVTDLNTRQIRELDRDKTAVILVGGILEQHGPYLPAFTDGYLSQGLAADLAKAIAARPGWKALVFPQIPIGSEGFNQLGSKSIFPGTFGVRSSTLQSVFMDIASELGEQKFKWVFVVHVHGASLHNRALDKAGDFFHDTYGGRMVHLWGIVPVIGAWGKELQSLSEAEKKEEGVSFHAGMDETSLMLHRKPELVAPDYKKAPVFTGPTPEQSVAEAQKDEWPGYLGSPRQGSKVIGERVWNALSGSLVRHAMLILDGEDPRKFPRYSEAQAKYRIYQEMDRGALAHEEKVAAKQAEWLAKQKP